ncbi:hypothetical protein [Bradyrhizobium sp. USDA 4502]
MAISNVVALKEVVSRHETEPLDTVANAINIKLRLADKSDIVAEDHRLAAGQMLVSLRKRVEDEGLNWWKWANGRIDRSRRDIEKLMRIAKADDPEAAAEEAAQKNRAHQAKHRAKKSTGATAAYVSRTEPRAGTATICQNNRKLWRFIDDYCERTEAWFTEHQSAISAEGKTWLLRGLHSGADRLMRLAQSLDGR